MAEVSNGGHNVLCAMLEAFGFSAGMSYTANSYWCCKRFLSVTGASKGALASGKASVVAPFTKLCVQTACNQSSNGVQGIPATSATNTTAAIS